MRQKSMSRKDPVEKTVRDIRRKTRKQYSAEEIDRKENDMSDKHSEKNDETYARQSFTFRRMKRWQLMMDRDAVTVVEVLDQENFDKFHLPSAINVPLSGNFEKQIQSSVPNKHEPVVVYCLDEDCDASPKAATQMEELGYDRVYDYEAGKMDWKSAGLPTEA